MDKGNKKRGFAANSPEKRREIARAGGRKAHRLGVAHQFSGTEAKIAGQKGGRARPKNIRQSLSIS